MINLIRKKWGKFTHSEKLYNFIYRATEIYKGIICLVFWFLDYEFVKMGMNFIRGGTKDSGCYEVKFAADGTVWKREINLTGKKKEPKWEIFS